MKTKRTNQWNLPYNSYNPVAEKRRDMENDAAIYKQWRKKQDQKKSEKSQKNPRIPIDTAWVIQAAQMYTTSYGICAAQCQEQSWQKEEKMSIFYLGKTWLNIGIV